MEELKKKILIINADDAGLSDDINKAVRRGMQQDVITSASIIACADTFKQASEMFHVMGKTSVGVHLTITGSFFPCSSCGKASFLLEDGRFEKDYQALLLKYLKGSIDMTEVKHEFSSQIEKVKSEGLVISHLDSHEHVHIFPAILDVVMELAAEHNIRYIRIPDEPAGVLFKDIRLKDMVRYSGLKAFVRGAKQKIREKGLICNDFFWGHYHSGRLNSSILSFMIDNMKEGINELCVHPAYTTSAFLEKYPWYKNSNDEIDSLLDGKFKNDLAKGHITLAGHEAI